MKTRGKNKQGISLIVLVITIIVMIILAAAVILSLSSNGIIGRANEAVDKTDKAQVQILANTIWADVYLDNLEEPVLNFENEVIERLNSALGLKEADTIINYYDVLFQLNGIEIENKSEFPAELTKYILGENGEGRSFGDSSFMQINENGKVIFVGDDVIKDADTSIKCLVIDIFEKYYGIIEYKGKTYKMYLDPLTMKTTKVEVSGVDLEANVYMSNSSGNVSLIRVYQKEQIAEILKVENNKYIKTFDTLSFDGNNIKMGTEIIGTINNGVLNIFGNSIEKSSIYMPYCNHEYIQDSEAHQMNMHVCKKCGMYEMHTNYDGVGDFYVESGCKCGFVTCTINNETQHDFVCDETGNCVCNNCGESYYDSEYDMTLHEHEYSCNETGECVCNYCDETYYDPEYDESLNQE